MYYLNVNIMFPAEIKMPSGKVDKPVIEDNRDGTVSISYGPKEEGLHELHIKYNGEHVQGMATCTFPINFLLKDSLVRTQRIACVESRL